MANIFNNSLLSAAAGPARSVATMNMTVNVASSSQIVIGNAGSFLRAYEYPIATEQYQVLETTAVGSLPGAEDYTLAITAATGKYEPVSFVLHSNEALSGMNITVGNLTGPGTINSSNIDVRLVKTWYQASSGNSSGDVGKYLIPELLLHDDAFISTNTSTQISSLLTNVSGTPTYVDITTVGSNPASGATFQDAATLQPFSMASGINKQVWITVYVPVGTTAGTYTGIVTVSASGKPDTYMSLTLTVLPFTLSASIIEQGIYYRAQLVASTAVVTPEARTSTQMAAEFANMVKHGVYYPNCYDSITSGQVPARLALMVAAGMPTDKIFQLGDSLSEIGLSNAVIDSRVASWQSALSTASWGDMYMYGIDEATGATFDSQLPAFDRIHLDGSKTFNAVPNLATSTRSGVDKMDIMVLYGYLTVTADVTTVHGTNPKVWRYGGPFTDMENPKYVRNHYGFGLLYQGYDGAMNYAYQHGLTAPAGVWNDFKTDPFADRNLCWTYPTTDGVVDTLQWEGYREAVDDIRYASTLKSVMGWTKAQLLTYIQGLSMLHDNPDSNDAPAARQQIITDILAAL